MGFPPGFHLARSQVLRETWDSRDVGKKGFFLEFLGLPLSHHGFLGFLFGSLSPPFVCRVCVFPRLCRKGGALIELLGVSLTFSLLFKRGGAWLKRLPSFLWWVPFPHRGLGPPLGRFSPPFPGGVVVTPGGPFFHPRGGPPLVIGLFSRGGSGFFKTRPPGGAGPLY